ncbi:hypothetical protein Tco_1311487 [Tanacetum coccineum]
MLVQHQPQEKRVKASSMHAFLLDSQDYLSRSKPVIEVITEESFLVQTIDLKAGTWPEAKNVFRKDMSRRSAWAKSDHGEVQIAMSLRFDCLTRMPRIHSFSYSDLDIHVDELSEEEKR